MSTADPKPAGPAADEPPPWTGVLLWRGKVSGRWHHLALDSVLPRPVARVWGAWASGTWWRLATEVEERDTLRAG